MSTSSSGITPVRRRPEVEVLLGCARTRMEPEVAWRVTDALKDGIDWDYLIYQTFYHGTAPLLFRNLSRIGAGTIPEATLNQLRGAVSFIARWNLSATGELLKLLRLFGESGIRALPLKGPVLGLVAYGDLSLRSFGDLDILMPREDILKAKDVLLQRGYQPALQLNDSEERAYLQTHHDYQFSRSGDEVAIELQWGVTQWSFAFPLDFDEIWQNRGRISLAGSVVPTISTEELLLMLCVHGTKHRWERLKWVCDIAELIVTYRHAIAWDRLMDQARALGGERMLLIGFFLAHDLLSTAPPNHILKRILDEKQVKSIAGGVSRGLCHDGYPARLRDETPLFYWRSRERLRDKWALLWRYFPDYFFRLVNPNERDRVFLPLPSFLSSSYFLVRPFRLLRESSSGVLRRFHRSERS